MLRLPLRRLVEPVASGLGVAILLGALLLGTACTCKPYFTPAVVITVVDAANAPVRDAVVSYSVDGGAPETASCVPPPHPGATTCDTWHAGGSARRIAVAARSADARRSASRTVDVESDGCHPEQQRVTLVLK